MYNYPEEEQEVNVKVGNPERLTHTYPKYEESWNVIAMPNGDLTDTITFRVIDGELIISSKTGGSCGKMRRKNPPPADTPNGAHHSHADEESLQKRSTNRCRDP